MCSPWEDFTRNPDSDKPVMCCSCLEWRAYEELSVDPVDGELTDLCIDCDKETAA